MPLVWTITSASLVQLDELAKVLLRQQVHVGAAAASNSPSEAEFRQEAIDRLVSAASAKGAAMILGTMVDSAPRLLDGLQRSLAAGDAKEFRRSAHSLKANAATVGADALAGLFQELENLGTRVTYQPPPIRPRPPSEAIAP